MGDRIVNWLFLHKDCWSEISLHIKEYKDYNALRSCCRFFYYLFDFDKTWKRWKSKIYWNKFPKPNSFVEMVPMLKIYKRTMIDYSKTKEFYIEGDPSLKFEDHHFIGFTKEWMIESEKYCRYSFINLNDRRKKFLNNIPWLYIIFTDHHVFITDIDSKTRYYDLKGKAAFVSRIPKDTFYCAQNNVIVCKNKDKLDFWFPKSDSKESISFAKKTFFLDHLSSIQYVDQELIVYTSDLLMNVVWFDVHNGPFRLFASPRVERIGDYLFLIYNNVNLEVTRYTIKNYKLVEPIQIKEQDIENVFYQEPIEALDLQDFLSQLRIVYIKPELFYIHFMFNYMIVCFSYVETSTICVVFDVDTMKYLYHIRIKDCHPKDLSNMMIHSALFS